ncbi:MAG: pur operon repressor [Clostridiales bacterium 38-18]|nr:MAG: pur operon repressor [Clostridiales bacterium 38-18]
MSKLKRNERIGAIVKILCDSPNKVFTLNYFTNRFDSAKSTISEDLVIVKKIMEEMSLGKVVTIAGASGGAKYVPQMGREEKQALIERICEDIRKPERVMPGKYLYMADILYNPTYTKGIGDIFAEKFSDDHTKVDYVLTIETKGIPIAMMTARGLNVPLVIARHENKVTEGSKISINYISGTTGNLQTMYISKNAFKKDSNVLIVDDFMKAGGSAKGMTQLVHEMDCHVAGVCVLFDTTNPSQKLLDKYISLIKYEGIDAKDAIMVHPNYEYL